VYKGVAGVKARPFPAALDSTEAIMAFDQRAGGHRFTERGCKCIVCEMTWAKFEDGGRSRCTGQKPPERGPIEIPDDE
jgi:hypothetical protein